MTPRKALRRKDAGRGVESINRWQRAAPRGQRRLRFRFSSGAAKTVAATRIKTTSPSRHNNHLCGKHRQPTSCLTLSPVSCRTLPASYNTRRPTFSCTRPPMRRRRRQGGALTKVHSRPRLGPPPALGTGRGRRRRGPSRQLRRAMRTTRLWCRDGARTARTARGHRGSRG